MPKPSLTNTSTLRSACLLAGALLLSGCSLLSKDQSVDANAVAAVTGPPNFELDIQSSNKDVRELLQQHMELQRYRTLPGLHEGELQQLFSAAEKDIQGLLGTLGYFAPVITVSWPEEGPYTVLVQVDPGPPTIVQRTHVTFTHSEEQAANPEVQCHWERGPDGTVIPPGQMSFQSPNVRCNWDLLPGEQFTQSDWSSAKNDAVRRLQNRRYPTASLKESRADIDAETHEAELRADYVTGPAYYFGPLVICANPSGAVNRAPGRRAAEGRTPEERCDPEPRYNPSGPIRLARLPVGEEYRQTSLLDTQQRLASSGLYDSVFLTLKTDVEPSEKDVVHAPVYAHVREARLQKWIYGLGLSTDTGARLSVDHTHNRVPYLGWRALNKVQLDRKNPLLSTRLTSMPDYSGWNYFVGAKAERQELADFDTNSMQLLAGRSKSEDKIDRTYFAQYDMAKPQGDGAPPSSSALTANYGWTGRYFNNPTNPTRGYGFGWEIGAGSTITPARQAFGRLSARWLYLLPLGQPDPTSRRRSRLALRANGGAVIASDDAVVPITQLFLSGGDTTVRGYSYQSIGARSDNGKLLGGRYMASGSVEWQRPVTIAGNTSDWEHATFVDAGTVADKLNDSTLFVGVGTGIRWRSPVGPLQADLAYGLQTKAVRLHLRLGFNF